MKKFFALFISTTCFTGFLGKNGKGGGTYGSIAALILQVIFFYSSYGVQASVNVIIISFILGLLAIGTAEKAILAKWGPRVRHTGEICKNDFNQTNIDEFHGQFIAGLPVFYFSYPLTTIALSHLTLAFVLFRIFDIVKPWPIRNIERKLKGSPGIMLDDTVAGAISGLIMFFIIKIILA